MKKLALLFLSIFAIFILAGCGDSKPTPEGIFERPRPDGITTVLTLKKIGDNSYEYNVYSYKEGRGWKELTRDRDIYIYDEKTHILESNANHETGENLILSEDMQKLSIVNSKNIYTRVDKSKEEQLKKEIGI